MIGQLSMGGTETQLLVLIQNLNRQKFSPLVVCLSKAASLAPRLHELGCPLYVLDRERWGRAVTFVRVYQVIKQTKPDIVQAFAYAGRAAIPAAEVAGIPFKLFSIRTDPSRETSTWDRWIIKLADLVLTNSLQAKAALHRAMGKKLGNCKVIYNGIHLGDFDQRMSETLDLPVPEIDLLSPQREIICAVARLEQIKSLDILLKAFAMICGQLSSTQLWLVGDGPMQAELQGLASELGIAEKVVFWGRRSDVPAILKRVSLGVLSSRAEGLPNALIEYMAARLPVVATAVGGIPELVINNETGLLVSPNDPAALANAMLEILTDADRAAQMGAAGRRRVEEHFQIERMVQETEALYKQLLSSQAGSVCPRISVS